MNQALVKLAKAFGQILDAHFNSFDRETSDLLNALAIWVSKYQSK